MEFQRDPFFIDQAELIYVLDDPDLVHEMHGLAPHLYADCGVPFRWVSAGQNRGFSGANNLGVSIARAETLIFLNSDVFPVQSGWAAHMTNALGERPDIGLVGPRLLFPDGTIQHASMVPHWQDGLGMWTNRHPLMGMDARFDSAKEPTLVPLLTGACLAIRRSEFDRVGGWDTGYLFGDFEDSDLCLKVRDLGLSCLYLPQTSLVHLERQSFVEECHRTTTLMNAVLYNQRWRNVLDGMQV